MSFVLFGLGFVCGMLLTSLVVVFELLSNFRMFVGVGDQQSAINALKGKNKPRGAILKSYDDQAWLNEIPSYDTSRDSTPS